MNQCALPENDCGAAVLDHVPVLQRVPDYLALYAARCPNREALVLAPGGLRLSYAQFDAELTRIQHAMLALGIRKGERVAMLSGPRPEFMLVFLAVCGIGAVWMGLNPRYSRSELEYVVRDAAPVAIFSFCGLGTRDAGSDLQALAALPGVRHLVTLDHPLPGALSWEHFMAVPADDVRLDAARAVVAARDPALLVYTSGTTGRPKGALLSHFGLVHCSRIQGSHMGHLGQRALNNLPINHVGCVGDIATATLLLGGTLIFMEQFEPGALITTLGRERISLWGQVPTMFQMTLAHPQWADADLSSLRYLVWSGAMMPRSLVSYFRTLPIKLGSAYGMTETVGSVCFTDDRDSIDVLSETIGRPDPHYQVRLADPDGRALPPGLQGEIQVRGPFLLLEYLGRTDATAAAYTADGWLKTGDAALVRPDGAYELKGRLVEMYKSGGYNVYPREVERVLESHPAVALACVIGVPDELFGEVGHALVVLHAALDAAVLRAHCALSLANYKLPKQITLLDSLPMLPIGKVDRMAVKQQLLSKLLHSQSL